MARTPRGPDKKPRKSSPYSTERRHSQGSELRACAVCGAEFWVPRWQRKVKGGGTFCSRPCRYKGSTAHKQRRSTQVTKLLTGYLLEWAPDHPRSSRGRVLQHILVAEAVLGRPLKANEEVHHVNGRRDDNRPENLQVMLRGEHQRLHALKPDVREGHSRRGKRLIAARRRDPLTGRLLPND